MRILTLLSGLFLVVGIQCGGGTTETPAASDAPAGDGTPPPPEALAEAGFPAEAFAELTREEMETYVNCQPGVAEAIDASGYNKVEKDQNTLMQDMSQTIEGMKDVPGVVEAVEAAGSNWNQFRVTSYKVQAAAAPMTISLAEAFMEELGGDEEGLEEARAELEEAKQFFAGVPASNQSIIVDYFDKLEAMDALEGE